MLTADQVRVRRSGDELIAKPLDAKARREAERLAGEYLAVAKAYLGARREDLELAWEEVEHEPKDARMAAGLRKLVEDGCTIEADESLDPVALRRDLFTRAAEARRNGTFDRAALLEGTDERALFADIRAEHILRAAPSMSALALVDAYDLGQAQAVLLRAVRAVVEVKDASPGLLRAFFSKLKFLQLLYRVERGGDAATLRIVVDGPYSLFESVTKYGLKFAMLLTALRNLDSWSLVADVRWGKTREALTFRLATPRAAGRAATGGALTSPEPHLSDDVRALLEGIRKLGTTWRVEPAAALLDVPGVGVCVPDLVLSRDGVPTPIYVEVLGFWSRDAVFKRLELVERGLGAPILFAASSRLRVSEELLDETAPAALYVYKGKMSPRVIVDRAARLATQADAGRGRSEGDKTFPFED